MITNAVSAASVIDATEYRLAHGDEPGQDDEGTWQFIDADDVYLPLYRDMPYRDACVLVDEAYGPATFRLCPSSY